MQQPERYIVACLQQLHSIHRELTALDMQLEQSQISLEEHKELTLVHTHTYNELVDVIATFVTKNKGSMITSTDPYVRHIATYIHRSKKK